MPKKITMFEQDLFLKNNPTLKMNIAITHYKNPGKKPIVFYDSINARTGLPVKIAKLGGVTIFPGFEMSSRIESGCLYFLETFLKKTVYSTTGVDYRTLKYWWFLSQNNISAACDEYEKNSGLHASDVWRIANGDITFAKSMDFSTIGMSKADFEPTITPATPSNNSFNAPKITLSGNNQKQSSNATKLLREKELLERELLNLKNVNRVLERELLNLENVNRVLKNEVQHFKNTKDAGIKVVKEEAENLRKANIFLMKELTRVTNEATEWMQLAEGTKQNEKTQLNFWDIIGKNPGDPDDEVKHAFRMALKMYHPDVVKGAGLGPLLVESANEILKVLSQQTKKI